MFKFVKRLVINRKIKKDYKILKKQIKDIICSCEYQLLYLTLTFENDYYIKLKLVCLNQINLTFKLVNKKIYFNNNLVRDCSGFNTYEELRKEFLDVINIEISKERNITISYQIIIKIYFFVY